MVCTSAAPADQPIGELTEGTIEEQPTGEEQPTASTSSADGLDQNLAANNSKEPPS